MSHDRNGPQRLRIGPQGPSADPPASRPGRGLTGSEIETDIEVLTTLANRTRYETLRRIAEAGEELCVCEIEPALDVSQGAVSQALARLTDAGLVTRRKQGRWRYYRTSDRAERLLDVLDELRDRDGS